MYQGLEVGAGEECCAVGVELHSGRRVKGMVPSDLLQNNVPMIDNIDLYSWKLLKGLILCFFFYTHTYTKKKKKKKLEGKNSVAEIDI